MPRTVRPARSKPVARTTPSVTGLEARDTPAALANFNAVTGQRTVAIDNRRTYDECGNPPPAAHAVRPGAFSLARNPTRRPSLHGSGFGHQFQVEHLLAHDVVRFHLELVLAGGQVEYDRLAVHTPRPPV